MNDVIESCKYHQHDDDREPNAQPDLLGAFRRFQLDLAMLDLFEWLPAVSRDAARVALSRRGNCRRCDGLKKVQDATDAAVTKIDELVTKKEAEIMEV